MSEKALADLMGLSIRFHADMERWAESFRREYEPRMKQVVTATIEAADQLRPMVSKLAASMAGVLPVEPADGARHRRGKRRGR